jgi:hypothetical protein
VLDEEVARGEIRSSWTGSVDCSRAVERHLCRLVEGELRFRRSEGKGLVHAEPRGRMQERSDLAGEAFWVVLGGAPTSDQGLMVGRQGQSPSHLASGHLQPRVPWSVDELEDGPRRVVALAEAKLFDARIAACPPLVTFCELLEELRVGLVAVLARS